MKGELALINSNYNKYSGYIKELNEKNTNIYYFKCATTLFDQEIGLHAKKHDYNFSKIIK